MTTAPTRNLDVAGDALARMPSIWRDAPRMAGVARAIGDVLQDVETRFGWPLYEALTDSRLATSDRLDLVGSLVGESRGGRNDRLYRGAVDARIKTSRSTGTPVELADILTLLSSGVVRVMLRSGEIGFEIDNPEEFTVAQRTAFAEQVESATPAGIGSGPIVEAAPVPFRLDSSGFGLDAGHLSRTW